MSPRWGVAKNAADDASLPDKDLDVLVGGVVSWRIFVIKDVLMGTSSKFGNMFSAAVAAAPLSAVLGFRLLSIGFFITVGGLVVVCLILVKLAKRLFFARLFFAERSVLPAHRWRDAGHRVHRRSSRFTPAGRFS